MRRKWDRAEPYSMFPGEPVNPLSETPCRSTHSLNNLANRSDEIALRPMTATVSDEDDRAPGIRAPPVAVAKTTAVTIMIVGGKARHAATRFM